jgi:integrase
MATIKFLVQSKSETAPVYCRLSISKFQVFKRKTGVSSNKAEIEKVNSLRSNLDANQKALQNNLERLSAAIKNKLNEDTSNGVLIDGNWLETTIENHFGRSKTTDLEYLTAYAQYFIDNLPFKVSNTKGQGVSEATKKKYVSILNKLLSFEKFRKRKYLVKEVDLNFRNDFLKYLIEVDRISRNTAGRYIKFVKTFVLDAQKNGQEINPQMRDFKGYALKVEKITLSFDELETLRLTTFENPTLEAAKDWLIIGCYTGQRVSDLLRMNKKMIYSTHGFDLIEITQQKTGKKVEIPVHPIVHVILTKRNGEFPETLGNTADSRSALFNRSIKKVCCLAGFNSLEKGSVYNSEKKENIEGQYEKWQLVTSHICRRSFATNYYADQKYPTALLINITAHSTEKQFLDYIGKPPLDFSLQLAKVWANEVLSSAKEPQMRVVPQSKVAV